jgi:hypothetical protein
MQAVAMMESMGFLNCDAAPAQRTVVLRGGDCKKRSAGGEDGEVQQFSLRRFEIVLTLKTLEHFAEDEIKQCEVMCMENSDATPRRRAAGGY